jgi:O-antigen ligase
LSVELRLFVVLLFAVPARLVVPGLGAAGAPALLLGLVMFLLLVLEFAFPQSMRDGRQRSSRPLASVNPVMAALACYLALVFLSWATGRMRPISSLASTTSDRALLTIVSLVGVTLFVSNRVRSVRDASRLIDALLLGATFMCCIGLVQFFSGVDLTTVLRPPGLVVNNPGSGVATRSIFNRPSGTALHAIEFGVVAAALTPIAWWRAKHGHRWHWLVLGCLAFSALASISRSAILALAIGGLVLLIGSNWRDRLTLAVAGLASIGAAGVMIPGLVGTLRSLFANADVDPSVQARLDRTPAVLRLIEEHKWFGRGFGTYTPDEYLLLDNEIQKMAIETGVIGVAIFAGVILWIVWVAAITVPRSRNTDLDGLVVALIASTLAIVISFYTFDAFFYRILMGVLFINFGLISALWRLHVPAARTAFMPAGSESVSWSPPSHHARVDQGRGR